MLMELLPDSCIHPGPLFILKICSQVERGIPGRIENMTEKLEEFVYEERLER